MDDDAYPPDLYVSAVCDAGVYDPVEQHVDPAWLDPEVSRFLQRYVDKAKRAPNAELVVRKFPSFQYTPDVDVAYAVEELREHAHRNAVAGLLGSGVSALQESGPDAAREHLHTGLNSLDAFHSTAAHGGAYIDDESLFVADDDQLRIPVPDTAMTLFTGGIRPGHYWVVGARLKTGKTWQLIRYALAALEAGVDVTFVSLENPKIEVAVRTHALMLGGYATHDEDLATRREHVRKWLEERGNPRLLVVDRTDHAIVTANTLARYCRGDNLLIVDYLGKMNTNAGQAVVEDWRAAALVSNEVQALAARTVTPVVAAVQLSRSANSRGSRTPEMTDIADTDVVARDIDVAHFIWRNNDEPVMAHTIGANRHGTSGTKWFTSFEPERPQFTELRSTDAIRLLEQHRAKGQ